MGNNFGGNMSRLSRREIKRRQNLNLMKFKIKHHDYARSIGKLDELNTATSVVAAKRVLNFLIRKW
jgi:hypothetical protein